MLCCFRKMKSRKHRLPSHNPSDKGRRCKKDPTGRGLRSIAAHKNKPRIDPSNGQGQFRACTLPWAKPTITIIKPRSCAGSQPPVTPPRPHVHPTTPNRRWVRARKRAGGGRGWGGCGSVDRAAVSYPNCKKKCKTLENKCQKPQPDHPKTINWGTERSKGNPPTQRKQSATRPQKKKLEKTAWGSTP